MTEPRILFLGCDKGAWQMRGRQMAQALGASYSAKFYAADVARADLVVLVKRAAEVWAPELKAAGGKYVWDVLDFWRQPGMNHRTIAEHLHALEQPQRWLNVRLLIGATRAMASDIGGVYLPHHSRIGLAPTPPRPTAKVVGYDGSPRYLGAWAKRLEHACERLRLRFVINPENLADVDVLVAFRDDEWNGPACTSWKSGVKYVNAIAAGRPILTQPCKGFAEIAPTGLSISHHDELEGALRSLATLTIREIAYEHGRTHAPAYRLEAVAQSYRDILHRVARRAA